MTNQVNQEFEKWFKNNIQGLAYPNNEPAILAKHNAKCGWQAATQYSESEINSLKQRVDELEAWKNEAIAVESEWDCQSVGKALNIQFGQSIRANILPKITALQADNLRLREALTQLTALKFSTASHIQKLDAVDKIANKALSATHAQSLAEHDNEVIEKCAKACDYYAVNTFNSSSRNAAIELAVVIRNIEYEKLEGK